MLLKIQQSITHQHLILFVSTEPSFMHVLLNGNLSLLNLDSTLFHFVPLGGVLLFDFFDQDFSVHSFIVLLVVLRAEGASSFFGLVVLGWVVVLLLVLLDGFLRCVTLVCAFVLVFVFLGVEFLLRIFFVFFIRN